MAERFSDSWLNSFARECFVETGDRDYLCARAAWRHNLVEHFLWNGLQAVEKYLKAILLYNGRSAKGLSHNLEKAYNRVRAIDDIPFDFPDSVQEFIGYLNRHGPNRYLEIPFYARGHELVELDRAVWYLRRYCQPLRWPPEALKKSVAEWIEIQMGGIQHARNRRRPHRFRLHGGFLEAVLDGRQGVDLRRNLVWHNVFYGSRWKPRIRVGGVARSAIPPHYRHPELFADFERFVDFPKSVHKNIGALNGA